MKILILLAIVLCAHATDVNEKEDKYAEPEHNKDKRQTEDELVPTRVYYRAARKQEVRPVEEPQEDDKAPASRSDSEMYRPGQVFSLNPQELMELQPERKAPLSSNQLLQQLYGNPQQESKQNLQQLYYLEPQAARQVAHQPSSHAVIARPHYSSNGGEASVGAALSVSDTGARGTTDSFDQELLALLGQAQVGQDDRQQAYSPTPQVQQASTVQSVAPLYQQVDRYVSKPSKKPVKLRSKVQNIQPQAAAAPQQYLIETTNVQQQQQQQQQPQQYQYRAPQPQRAPQALRYVPFQQVQQVQPIQQILYERPENQGLKVVAAPKLQQARPQLNFRFVPQYQQPEAAPKQYRIIEAARPQPIRQEQRLQASSVERPVTYLKRYPENEKMRSVKIYDPIVPEGLPLQPAQIVGEQYYLRPAYRTEQRGRYELSSGAGNSAEQQRGPEPTKPPHSAIYVSKNLAPRKQVRPQNLRYQSDQSAKIEQQARDQSFRYEQPSNLEQVSIEQNGQNLEEQRSHLPPPKNSKAYTPEEFAALVAAGYSVTPVPISALNAQVAESRSSIESVTPQPKRRLSQMRRHQYLPRRGDDAP